MQRDVLFFDLDETLYTPECGVWQAIRDRIDLYLHDRMGFTWEEIPARRLFMYETYGTTMRGLAVEYGIDQREYADFVHDVPLRQFLQPRPALAEMIASLPYRRMIFTNADSRHAARVLGVLQLDHLFEKVIDVFDIQPYTKPQPEAFHRALALAGGLEPEQVVMIDDSLNNLRAARRLGFYTVRVGYPEITPDCDACIHDVIDLPRALPA